MRALFLLLVLANLAFFAWSRYGGRADADPTPLSRQIEPEKLKVIAPGDLPPPVSALKKSGALALACLEWGSFSVADAPRAEQALEPLNLGARLTQRRAEEIAGWWVFVPPQGSRQGAVRKANELKSLGIDDYFIMPDDWALSLGVFRSEEAAQARLSALRAQGVRSARVGARETVVPRVWLQVKSVEAPLQARLKEVARQVEGTELKDCP